MNRRQRAKAAKAFLRKNATFPEAWWTPELRRQLRQWLRTLRTKAWADMIKKHERRRMAGFEEKS